MKIERMKKMDFDVISMKKRTKQIMKSTIPNVILLSIIPTLLPFIVTILDVSMLNLYPKIFIVSYLVGTIIINMCNIGYISCILNAVQVKKFKWIGLFTGFYKKTIKIVIVIILKQIILAIGFLLLYVPAIILFYKLRFLYYELTNENKSIGRTFIDSMKLMKGHCIELFKIDVGFVGWYILNIVTLGLAGFYVKPLTTITYAEYYDYL